MISAVSLRQPLNGNNFLFASVFFLLLGLFWMSCSTSKKTVNPKSIPEKKTDVSSKPDPSQKVDTVVWKEKKLDPPVVLEKDKITSKPTTAGKQKIKTGKVSKSTDEFQILVLLPLKLTETDTNTGRINPSLLRYIHFYAGMELASQEYSGMLSKPVTLKIQSVSESGDLQKILDDFRTSPPHLIVGPQKLELLKEASIWAKEYQTTLISPWVSGSNLVEENPFYIQIKPTLANQYKFMNEHARKSYAASNITLVLRDDDEGKELYFNDSSEYAQKIQIKKFKESDLVSSNELLIKNMLRETGTNVFILPMGFSRDENFVYHFLRRAAAEKETKDVVIYGMSKWLEMKSDVVDMLHTLKVRMSAGNFSDADSQDLKNFKRKFFDRYREFPTQDALEGYDLMSYCIKSLDTFGPDFHLNQQTKLQIQYLQTDFELKPMYKDSKLKDANPDYFENSYIRMIELKNNRLKVVD
ncbi:MAG: hypothetical protein IPM48_10450 [Saprospiraceae bacterium]|nr:hypothetical protein [Saprospiraceae bacterium]